MEVRAIYFDKNFKIPKIRKAFPEEVKITDPLVLTQEQGKYIVVLKYGVIVFWGFKEAEASSYIRKLSKRLGRPLGVLTEETIEVSMDGKDDEVLDGQVILAEVTPEKVAVVSLVLGRSLAVEHYEKSIDQSFSDFDDMVRHFGESGSFKVSTKDLLKKAAFVMNIRHDTMNRISVLDSPELTWDDTALYDFYKELMDDYEIEDRYQILGQKISAIHSDSEFLLDLINTRRSHWLEITIVALIVLEIIIFVYEIWFI